MSILANHADTICTHPEQINILRTRLMPVIIRILSDRFAFSTTVRAMRLLPLIFSSMLSVLPNECETALSLLNHNLDPDITILWKRILCMEVFRSVHGEPTLVRSMYAQFDEQEGRKNIVRDNVDIMVRLSAERPSIIGLGPQSSIPAAITQTEDVTDEEAALQAEGVAITKGSAKILKASDAPGISAQWSIMRIPCIDQLDKSEPPDVPPAYIYTLTLICINAYSEGLARFILPFSLPSESRSRKKQRTSKQSDTINDSLPSNIDGTSNRDEKEKLSRDYVSLESRVPVNPLSLENHVLHSQIKSSAGMVDTCWPALLATYSTFFHAALDTEFFHVLVRSFQKLTQVAGILRLSTPRDAFLTTLGKSAVPPATLATIAKADLTLQSVDKNKLNYRKASGQEAELHFEASPKNSSELSRQSMDTSGATLNTRNLLCMRALLNLGIALGPVLQEAWSIIFKSLQHVDSLIAVAKSKRKQSSSGQITPTILSGFDSTGEFGNEIAAMKLAAERLLESCSELPDEAFLDVISSLRGLLRNGVNGRSWEGRMTVERNRPPSEAKLQKPPNLPANSVGQYSIFLANVFVIENISKLIEFNIRRLLGREPAQNGWNFILSLLTDVLTIQDFDSNLRLKAADALRNLFTWTTGSGISLADRDEIRERGLTALNEQVQLLYSKTSKGDKASKSCEIEIHQLSLEALRFALEQYGDSLTLGWDCVFDIVTSIFERDEINNHGVGVHEKLRQSRPAIPQSTRLVRISFGSLELICSDFLNSVPQTCLVRLIDTLHRFCSQQHDLNISLTVS